MIGTCKKCGNAYETTERDANIPLWYAGPLDRLCPTCYYRFYYKNKSEVRKA
jgi:DNA-directed RNA polymerase subunit RPC12/RpoP